MVVFDKEVAFIDAGIEHIHIVLQEGVKRTCFLLKNNDEAQTLLSSHDLLESLKRSKKILLTGKMASILQSTIGAGKVIASCAAIWQGAKYKADCLNRNRPNPITRFGVLELSASGYVALCIGPSGALVDDLLEANPKCGAGSGINLNRILEKLAIDKEDVDKILQDYLGDAGAPKRKAVSIRADRCGVFSSSATISDKNQGIPLDHALAVTLKSEVHKACKKMIASDVVLLTGRVFMWEYARDCAKDYLHSIGVGEVVYDSGQDINIDGMCSLKEEIGYDKIRFDARKLIREESMPEYPSFLDLRQRYSLSGLYERLPESEIVGQSAAQMQGAALNIGIDAGSTMAKIVVTRADDDTILKIGSYDNHGDTVETVKKIFQSFKDEGITKLNIQHIGLTGSGRYQVQKVLRMVYPALKDRIFTLVENYAHAYGSIEYAKEQIANCSQSLNKDFYVMVDIGGEDTKISVIALGKEELFDNAMNVKCSAGTGSLMDTLKSLFSIPSIGEACSLAETAKRAYEINATCAVFLMENAKKMQSQGYPRGEILASCDYAIIENMDRTLWNRIDFPKDALVMLHGQTMQSDPLPLAVTHKLQERGKMRCVVPPYPGHRACIGLVKSIRDHALLGVEMPLDSLLDTAPSRKIFYCRGSACGDSNSCCARTLLTLDAAGSHVSVMLGGCTAVNSLGEIKTDNASALETDSYLDIWRYVDSMLPRSKEENRLVIPRSFAVSEWAFFLSRIFERLGIPVFVDDVKEEDILRGQRCFSVDVCAPLIGASGQYSRLAGEPHGMILVPQIDFLPTDGVSLGRTCTTNQGGVLIAMNHARMAHPDSRFHLFSLDLGRMDPARISAQIYDGLTALFDFYKVVVTRGALSKAIEEAIQDNKGFKSKIAVEAARHIQLAIDSKRNIAVVCGREYILNPKIYDSHIGRLLKDKGIVAIPAYALETGLDKRYSHIYWRNPHDLLTKIDAVTKGDLHSVLVDGALKGLIKQIEENKTHTALNIVQVSTFRCGPDTVTQQIAAQIAKGRPNLFIQSDAMIKELAHLENRVLTFMTQIEKKLHEEFKSDEFDIGLLDEFSSSSIDKESDVVYVPTLHENRMITSVLRGAGISAIDNYQDESYDLRKKVMMGRKYAGDAVCAPLAAVFGDIILAGEDFARRKREGDPLVAGKTRVLVLDNKGTGPCRQGQYCELHKLMLHKRSLAVPVSAVGGDIDLDSLRLVVSEEKNAFNIGLEEWALVQVYQGVILQGILHSILLRAGEVCKSREEYDAFNVDYADLKRQIFSIMESHKKPNESVLLALDKLSVTSSSAGSLGKYFLYGLHNNNGFRKVLSKFAKRWLVRQGKAKIKIHIEGEAYVRAAQVEEIFKELIDALGFGSFSVDYTPIWCYMELLLEENISDAEEEIRILGNLLLEEGRQEQKAGLSAQIKEKTRRLEQIDGMKRVLRKVLVQPLYSAARIEIPHEVHHVLDRARVLIPSLKPQGELPPYVGESLLKSDEGCDLFLNVAPESCMVSSMGQAFKEPVMDLVKSKMRIAGLFTQNGEVNRERLELALLKTLGPMKYYNVMLN